LSISFLLLVIFALQPIPHALLHHLESQYKPLVKIPKNITKIVVLGGGVGGHPNYPPNTRLNSASLSRLLEGIRIYRLISLRGNKPELILSGGRVFRSPSNAGVMHNTAVILGVTPKKMKLENGSKDTYQEAIYLKKDVGTKPFILVTSAAHMPRAMALFKKQGMRPIPAPTQYLTGLNRFTIRYYFPNSLNLIYSDIALHEYIGYWWAWVNGEVS
jgi:uncharacterized SAM-binding protein YcdF (DUF218 family)